MTTFYQGATTDDTRTKQADDQHAYFTSSLRAIAGLLRVAGRSINSERATEHRTDMHNRFHTLSVDDDATGCASDQYDSRPLTFAQKITSTPDILESLECYMQLEIARRFLFSHPPLPKLHGRFHALHLANSIKMSIIK